jgi:hypothetical protein
MLILCIQKCKGPSICVKLPRLLTNFGFLSLLRYRSTLRLVTRTHQASALSEKKDWKLDLSKAHRKLVRDFVPSYCSFYLSDVNDYVQ